MEIRAKKEKGATIVMLEGRLDAVSSRELNERLADLFEGGARTVILNLAGVDYISSAGLRSILTAAKKMKSRNGHIILTCVQDMVMGVLKMSGFADILPIHVSDQDALRCHAER